MKELIPNYRAAPEMELQIDAFRDRHDLTGAVKLEAVGRMSEAEQGLARIVAAVGQERLDETVAGYIDTIDHTPGTIPEDVREATAIGVEAVSERPLDSPRTARELGEVQLDALQESLSDLGEVRGDDAVEVVVAAIETAESARASTGIPQFDQLDNYTPEFSGQILMHRSNAELNEGDIVLPSDQISPELYQELNKDRSFSSGSDPRKGEWTAGGYDGKLAHVGTRDFGTTYGKYLYVVEPLEGDTLKWGENFGADVNRKQRAESPAFGLGAGWTERAVTDSHTGKWHNEVVSTRGFRVVKRIPHEPSYGEAMLPWPVSANAVAKRKDRYKNKVSNVAPPNSNINVFVRSTSSRWRPGKSPLKNMPGAYRAGADERNPAEWRTRFDAMKQHAENSGQPALPGIPISKYGKPDRWSVQDWPIPQSPERPEDDTPLPGMEDILPSGPPEL